MWVFVVGRMKWWVFVVGRMKLWVFVVGRMKWWYVVGRMKLWVFVVGRMKLWVLRSAGSRCRLLAVLISALTCWQWFRFTLKVRFSNNFNHLARMSSGTFRFITLK